LFFFIQFVFIDRTKTNEFTEKDQQIKEYQSKYDQLNKENNDLRQQQRETEIQINQLQKEFNEKRQTNEQTQSEFSQRVSLLKKKNSLDNSCNYLDGKSNKRI